MPCRDDDYDPAREYRARIDRLTDAFCSVCTVIEKAGLDIPAGARSVWLAHKKADAARIERENAEGERKRLREDGLKKLTQAERDALGLRD
jgi:hypothetical protein